MRKILFLMALLTVTVVQAQKVDQRLTGLVEQVNARRAQGQRPINAKAVNKTMAVDFNADGSIRAFSAIAMLKEGAEWPTAQLEQMGIEVRYIVGNQAALVIPADKLLQLEQVEELSYVRADQRIQLTNKAAREDTKADISSDPVKAIANGLPQAYTGKGVVLGIIDSGIDFNHAAFRNADGTSRVVKAYVCGKTSSSEYDVNMLTIDTTKGSHGTHTAGTAGGSETGTGDQGVASEADLILFGLGDNMTTANINDGINKIFDYATSVNKPCVVSISMGSILGLHDGSDPTPDLVAKLTENGTKPGRAVLISSSNSAAVWQSILKKLDDTTTELKTVLGAASFPTKADPDKNVVYNTNYCFYADDYKDFDIQLKVVNLETGALSNISGQVLDDESGEVYDPQVVKYSEKTVTGATAAVYYLSFKGYPVRMKNNEYRLALVVKAKTAGQTIKMICDGDNNAEPCFDAPNEEGEYNFAANGYTKGNGDIACNIMICNDAVISVGSYITTNEWRDYTGKNQDYDKSALTGKKQVIGEISDFSSYCIDDNGKSHPTVIAPGQGIFSSASNWDKEMFKVDIENEEDQPGVPDEEDEDKEDALTNLIYYSEKHGRRNWYELEQGTSMSCPHAAGIVALWMQAKPELSVNDIKEIMKATCVKDDFTTNVTMIPSGKTIQAGYGKIDCLAGLKKITGSTGIEAVQAGGRREATPATMYSMDAPVYNMLGQRVDKAQKGLVIYKGRKYVNR
jgi:subtilisin family serine protease